MAVAVSVGAGCASLLIVALTLNSLVTASMDIRDIQTSEHADDIVTVSSLPDNAEGQINLNGYWKKSIVTVAFFSKDLTQHQFDVLVENAQDTMAITQQNASSTTISFAGWPDLLSSVSRQSKNVPALQVIQAGESADIKVYLEANPGSEGKPGKAKIARDKNTLEIIYSEVYIYSAYDSYRDGTFSPIFKHEMGHALGLGHATIERSIMHTPLVIFDNIPVGSIKECEMQAAKSLYVDMKVKTVACNAAQ